MGKRAMDDGLASIGLAPVLGILSYKRSGPPEGGPQNKSREDQPPLTGRRPPHGVGARTAMEHGILLARLPIQPFVLQGVGNHGYARSMRRMRRSGG